MNSLGFFFFEEIIFLHELQMPLKPSWCSPHLSPALYPNFDRNKGVGMDYTPSGQKDQREFGILSVERVESFFKSTVTWRLIETNGAHWCIQERPPFFVESQFELQIHLKNWFLRKPCGYIELLLQKGLYRTQSTLFICQQHWSPELLLAMKKNCFLSWKQAQWRTEHIHR